MRKVPCVVPNVFEDDVKVPVKDERPAARGGKLKRRTITAKPLGSKDADTDNLADDRGARSGGWGLGGWAQSNRAGGTA